MVPPFYNFFQKQVNIMLRHYLKIILSTVFIIAGSIDVMAIEEAKYEVIKKDSKFEIREYAPQIIAETIVEGDFENSGSKAFRRLFRYISGDNRSRIKVEMTTPVSQEPVSEKIKMTVPVGQQRIVDKWAVSFLMPSPYTLENLPEPDDPKVTIRKIPTRRMAAVRYSGFWSEKRFLRYKKELELWIEKNGFKAVGELIWARYNPPFTPWFLRRNEILIPIDAMHHE
jgi:effector-binding domain-containing protein